MVNQFLSVIASHAPCWFTSVMHVVGFIPPRNRGALITQVPSDLALQRLEGPNLRTPGCRTAHMGSTVLSANSLVKSELVLVSICPRHFCQLFRWKPDRQPGYLKEISSDKLYKCFCLCMFLGPSLYPYHSSPPPPPCYQPHSSSVSPPSHSQICSPPTARPSSAAITASSP